MIFSSALFKKKKKLFLEYKKHSVAT